jgi:hypothetical protein
MNYNVIGAIVPSSLRLMPATVPSVVAHFRTCPTRYSEPLCQSISDGVVLFVSSLPHLFGFNLLERCHQPLLVFVTQDLVRRREEAAIFLLYVFS